MSDSLNPSVNRRAFVKGAAGVVGAGALAQTGLASVLAPQAVVSVAFFDGTRLVAADRLPSTDSSLEQVEISIEARGKGTLRGLIANFPIQVKRARTRASFGAWQSGGLRSKFKMPVDPKNGLGFTVTQGTAKSEVATDVQFGRAAGAMKLREGTYVIAAGKVNWNAYRFDGESSNGPLLAGGGRPTSLQYVLLTIERI